MENKKNICKICANKKNNTKLYAKEMMLGLGHTFEYLECGYCHALSLTEIPEDMGEYYPEYYYSYTRILGKDSRLEPLKYLLRYSAMKGRLGCGNSLDRLVSKYKNTAYLWLKNTILTLESPILDVGCGNGALLYDMQKYGFSNLTGIDLYVKEEILEQNIRILQKDISTLESKTYTLIMYHHSFEHIINPHKELEILYHKLKDEGTLLIRIPLCDSYAFRKYREYWVQLDAPRHTFLHTIKSMYILAEKHHFSIEEVVYDSTSFQFTGSEAYLQNSSIKVSPKFFDEKAKELNELHDGDSACFYLKKISIKKDLL